MSWLTRKASWKISWDDDALRDDEVGNALIRAINHTIPILSNRFGVSTKEVKKFLSGVSWEVGNLGVPAASKGNRIAVDFSTLQDFGEDLWNIVLHEIEHVFQTKLVGPSSPGSKYNEDPRELGALIAELRARLEAGEDVEELRMSYGNPLQFDLAIELAKDVEPQSIVAKTEDA